MPAISNVIHARSTCISDGRNANPMNTRSGNATKPVRRSSTTEPKAMGDESTVAEARDTRSTSPPIVEGRTLPTNWPAK